MKDNNKNDKLLTILLPINVIGDNGNAFYFTPYRQYCYFSEGFLIEDDETFYYGVKIDTEVYLIPKDKVSTECRVLTEDEQLTPSELKEKDLYEKTVKDHKKRTLEVLGIDIQKDERTDFNGRWLAKFLGSN